MFYPLIQLGRLQCFVRLRILGFYSVYLQPDPTFLLFQIQSLSKLCDSLGKQTNAVGVVKVFEERFHCRLKSSMPSGHSSMEKVTDKISEQFSFKGGVQQDFSAYV